MTSGVGAVVLTWFGRSKSGINQWSNFARPLISAERRFPPVSGQTGSEPNLVGLGLNLLLLSG